jgi:ferric-dicitrate binding protein FerR (iron transport regulator)
MKVDFQVIKRYLEGNEKEGDKENIVNWFSRLEAEKDLRTAYKSYWDELAHKLDTDGYDGSIILGRIYHEIKLEESGSEIRKRRITRIINTISGAAAVFLVSLTIYALINRDNLMPSPGQEAYSEIYSPPGTRTMFYLPDGTTGWLNGDSYLEFPSEFKGKSRTVVLQGEAYFVVESDSKKSFVVSGDNIEVIAHGTSFNVLTYPSDKSIEVTLEEGSIKLSAIQKGMKKEIGTLKPDEMCIYDLEIASCKIIPVDAKQIISWKDGKLIFRDEPFKDVVRKLNRWYNVNIIIIDKILESHKYMATFEDETLDEVLKLLKLSAPIDYKDLGRKIMEDGTFEKRKIEIYYKP